MRTVVRYVYFLVKYTSPVPHIQLKALVPVIPSGVYSVKHVAGQTPFSPSIHMLARCDMETDRGGWRVIQRRIPKGDLNFVRKWSDYENGFGDLNGEFWYGLRNMHALTSQNDVELRIDMVYKDNGKKLTWTYQTFKVAGASEKYKLTVGGGKGTGRDAMAIQNGQMFTTIDQDNDKARDNCGLVMQGGWWYNACYYSNLNGPHTLPSTSGISRTYAKLIWNDGKSYRELSSVEMKIRLKKCDLPQETCDYKF